MKILSYAVAVGISGMAVLNTSSAAEDHVSKSFHVTPGENLVVDVDFGSVNISSHDLNEVNIDVKRKVSRFARGGEETFLRDRPVEIAYENGTVTVRSKAKQGWKLFGRGNWGRSEAKYTITVPTKFNARANTAGGGVKVENLQGDVNATTSGGGLTFTGIKGPLKGDTAGGGISARNCEGKLDLKTRGGGLDVNGGNGELKAETAGGGISLKQFAGSANVKSAGGSIDLEGVRAPLEAEASGGSISASISALPADDVRLSTAGGGIHVKVPENSAFVLDAEANGGNVRSDLPVQSTGQKQPSRLKGPVNGGGKVIALRSVGGGIQVQKTRAAESQSAEESE